eukprot:1073357-Alexandrium_andersonii.AAC.1
MPHRGQHHSRGEHLKRRPSRGRRKGLRAPLNGRRARAGEVRPGRRSQKAISRRAAPRHGPGGDTPL